MQKETVLSMVGEMTGALVMALAITAIGALACKHFLLDNLQENPIVQTQNLNKTAEADAIYNLK
jgi:hypothetical protein